jgi:hypothetical protein
MNSERFRKLFKSATTLPPIPERHFRILASDGGLHDVPIVNIEIALDLDPDLLVLNPSVDAASVIELLQMDAGPVIC